MCIFIRITLVLSVFLMFVGCDKGRNIATQESMEILFKNLEEGEIQEDSTAPYYMTNCRFTILKHKTFNCSQCGKETVYDIEGENKNTKEKEKYSDVLYSDNHQHRLKKLTELSAHYGLIISVDSTDFCSGCSRNDVKKHYLVIKYPEGNSVRSPLYEPEDLEKLTCFLEKKRLWSGYDGMRQSLRREIPLIRSFLGMGSYSRPPLQELPIRKKAEKAEDDYFELVWPRVNVPREDP